MRARTFLLFILVLIVAAVVIVLGFTVGGWGSFLGLGGDDTAEVVVDEPEEVDLGPPTPTPMPVVEVVVARTDLPVGTLITEEYVRVEPRPETNIAVAAGYVFNDVDDVVGTIARVDVAEGQEILNSMVALTPNDLLSMGSDLALYLTPGNVAIAFPIDRYSGAAYAMRPGDSMDVIMTVPFVTLDQEFQSALPNLEFRIDEQALAQSAPFLLEPFAEGRLELIPDLNVVGSIGPRGQLDWQPEEGELLQIPRRATQLTVQQARVIWVGTWQDPAEIEAAQARAAADAVARGLNPPTPEPLLRRSERQPDVVILSMTAQDALVLKWALDRGLDMDLALRAQGDGEVFVTSSVSLPQLVEQAGFTIPEALDIDVNPRADRVQPPSLPPIPPEDQ